MIKVIIFCFYKKNIKVSQIVRINYAQTGIIFFNIVLTSIFLCNINSIVIQVNTGMEEDELFYFGTVVGFEGYKRFCEVFREVTNRDRTNNYFL